MAEWQRFERAGAVDVKPEPGDRILVRVKVAGTDRTGEWKNRFTGHLRTQQDEASGVGIDTSGGGRYSIYAHVPEHALEMIVAAIDLAIDATNDDYVRVVLPEIDAARVAAEAATREADERIADLTRRAALLDRPERSER
ncbi:hypothetical protein [Nocardia sp. NPDC057227]|uniref:hypothetical protein n=1 Tax=Nocardia sp. NPDC057227 TaxID=3346056 RepID=UPI00362D8CA8